MRSCDFDENCSVITEKAVLGEQYLDLQGQLVALENELERLLGALDADDTSEALRKIEQLRLRGDTYRNRALCLFSRCIELRDDYTILGIETGFERETIQKLAAENEQLRGRDAARDNQLSGDTDLRRSPWRR